MNRIFVRIIIFLFILLGDVFIFLSLYLPWFTFSGTAKHAWGTVEVSGWVGAFGFGELYAGSAKVTMWSSINYTRTSASDFWFGRLIVIGLILSILAPLFVAKKPKISMIVTLIGCALAASASLIGILYYKPQVFVIIGFIYGAPPELDSALLYSTQAVVKTGLGPCFSLFGAFLSAIGIVQVYQLQKGGEKR